MLQKHILSQIYRYFKFDPTIGQKNLIEKLAEFLAEENTSDIFIVNGYAGTGKTTVISAVVNTLRSMRTKTVILAPTGRAAKVASVSSGTPAYTVHKKIYRQKSLADETSRFELDYNRENGAVFFVDESSMLSNSGSDSGIFGTGHLFDDLITYVRGGKGCKLVLVGDSAQLPPVGLEYSPALDPGFISTYGKPILVTLDEVMRQEQQSGILFNATLIRCMIEENIIDIPMFRTKFPDIGWLEGGEFLEEVANAYDRYGKENVIVITRSNKRANRFNEGIRNHVLFREEEISSGDMLMVVKNNYHYVPEMESEEEHGKTVEKKRTS